VFPSSFFTKKEQDGGHEQPSQDNGHGGAGEGRSSARYRTFTAGPRRPLDVRFSPQANAMYIADFGAMDVQAGAVPVPKTGVIRRVVPEGAQYSGPTQSCHHQSDRIQASCC
jgi:hypothetical protein